MLGASSVIVIVKEMVHYYIIKCKYVRGGEYGGERSFSLFTDQDLGRNSWNINSK